jgi:hypothetical protein
VESSEIGHRFMATTIGPRQWPNLSAPAHDLRNP